MLGINAEENRISRYRATICNNIESAEEHAATLLQRRACLTRCKTPHALHVPAHGISVGMSELNKEDILGLWCLRSLSPGCKHHSDIALAAKTKRHIAA